MWTINFGPPDIVICHSRICEEIYPLEIVECLNENALYGTAPSRQGHL